MTLTNEIYEPIRQHRPVYEVVHPLDDVAEQKVDTGNLGPMTMTPTVRACLFALRGYLFLMFGMLGFRVLQLAGVLRG